MVSALPTAMVIGALDCRPHRCDRRMIVGDVQVTEKLSLASKGPAKLVLGTAQLGQVYGAANRVGLPSEANAIALVHAALAGGVRTIDTARAYGESERRIGLALEGAASVEIVTKLDPLRSLPVDANPETAAAAARQSLAASRAALRRERLDVVLLHRAEHRIRWRGGVWRMLAQERDSGKIGDLGISATAPAEVLDALQDALVTHVQLPFNLLDHRWAEAGVIDALRQRPDVTVHVRSVFLQGLLAASSEARWPAIGGVDPIAILARLDRLALETGCEDRIDLCLAYVRSQDWIDGIVIGMETADQLKANLTAFGRALLHDANMAEMFAGSPVLPDTFLDPACWPREMPVSPAT
jgi:aryl-alcohol dehydrogenase-like predicted oxidoreductase